MIPSKHSIFQLSSAHTEPGTAGRKLQDFRTLSVFSTCQVCMAGTSTPVANRALAAPCLSFGREPQENIPQPEWLL